MELLDKVSIAAIIVALGFTSTLGIKISKGFFAETDYKGIIFISLGAMLCGVFIPQFFETNYVLVRWLEFQYFVSLLSILCLQWIRKKLYENSKYGRRLILKRFFIATGLLLASGFGGLLYYEIYWIGFGNLLLLAFLAFYTLFNAGLCLGCSHLCSLEKFKFQVNKNGSLNYITGYLIDDTGNYFTVKIDGVTKFPISQIKKEHILERTIINGTENFFWC